MSMTERELLKTIHDIKEIVRTQGEKIVAQTGQIDSLEKALKEKVAEAQSEKSAQYYDNLYRNREQAQEWETELTYCPEVPEYARNLVGDPRDKATRLDAGSVDGDPVGGSSWIGIKGVGAFRAMADRDPVSGQINYGLFDDPNPISDWQRDLQSALAQRTMVRSILQSRAQAKGRAQIFSPKSDRKILRILQKGPKAIQRIFSDSSGIGAEWIVDTVLPNVYEFLKLDRRVESIFQNVDIPAGGAHLIPRMSAGATPYVVGVSSVDDPSVIPRSSVTTAQNSIAATRFAVCCQVDQDFAEDAILAGMPIVERAAANALIDGYEDAVINGDTNGQDSLAAWNPGSRWASAHLGSSYDHRKAWIGLRARALDISTGSDGSAAQTLAGLQATRALMTGAASVGNVAIITSAKYYILKMLLFSEVLTLEKYGQLATITGSPLGSVMGMPLYLSDFMTSDLNNSGVFDNSTTDKTGLVLVHTPSFANFVRRQATVAIEDTPTRMMKSIVISRRIAFATVDSSTEKNVAYQYKLSTS